MKMLMEAKYIRRRRVAFALAVIASAVLVWAVYQAMGHIWWVGDHYCFDDVVSCYFPEEGAK